MPGSPTSLRMLSLASMTKMAVSLTTILTLCSNNSPAQIVSPIVAVRGISTSSSSLTNLTHGAQPNDCIDPSRPTYVITHGFNPFPNRYHLSTPEMYANRLRQCGGDRINVLAFHWNSRNHGSERANVGNAICRGRDLARALQARGVVPDQLTLIGHSMGSLVVSAAANSLFDSTGRCTHRLVLLDAPKRKVTTIVRDLNATGCATHVLNVWAGGITGIGKPIYGHQVTNIQAPNRRFQRLRRPHGPLRPARNRHLDVLIWYYETHLTSLLSW